MQERFGDVGWELSYTKTGPDGTVITYTKDAELDIWIYNAEEPLDAASGRSSLALAASNSYAGSQSNSSIML